MTRLVELSREVRESFGRTPLIARHQLGTLDLFSDAALVSLLDRFPKENLFALTMGDDPEHPEENMSVSHQGAKGAELLEAVKRGKLWLNVTRADEVEPKFRELVERLYGELAEQCPGFVPVNTHATLLISSPKALVYFHVDGPPSVLWHVRGKKRVWVYPALDEAFVSRAMMEDIFAAVAHEYVPYSSRFDTGARLLELEPGLFAAWPQNSPHRVTNVEGLNVSLSTEHDTEASRRRARVYQANRFFRVRAGFHPRSVAEVGLVPLAKVLTWKAASMVLRTPRQFRQHVHRMRLDPTAERGCVPLNESAP